MRLAVLLAIAGAAVALVAVAAFFVLSPSGPAPAPGRVPEPEPASIKGPSAPDEPEGSAPVAGVVVGEAGEPVFGASVYLLSPEDPLVPEEGPRRVVSGEGGVFSLRMREGEAVDLIAIRPGFRATRLERVVAGEGHRVVLARGAEIRGVVKDDLGRPLPGAQVTGRSSGTEIDPPRGLFLPNHASLGLTWARTLTGPDGAFTLAGVEDGPVDLDAAKRGYPEMLIAPTEVEPGRTDVKIVLLRPFRASVLVREKDSGVAAARVQISIEPEGGGWKAVRGFTDARGEFEKPLPFPAARAPDCAVRITVFSRRLGENVTGNIPLSLLEEGRGFAIEVYELAAAKLRIRLLYDTGVPYTRWGWFMIQPVAGEASWSGGRVDGEGWTELGLAPGHYEAIKLMGQRGPLGAELAGVKISPGETLERSMTIVRGGDLRVKILGERPERRIRGTLLVTAPGREAVSTAVWGNQLVLYDLPPGPVHLVLTLESHESVETTVEVIKDQLTKASLTPPAK